MEKKLKKNSLKKRIYKEVSKIKTGKTKTYKQIALSCKTSSRYVARVLSENPNPIKVPCHRVVRSDGKLGGYTFKGKRKDFMKIKLLKKEGIKIEKNRVV